MSGVHQTRHLLRSIPTQSSKSRLRVARAWNVDNACRFHSSSIRNAPEPFDILFLGRDEFSCIVLEQLYGARDVWQQISIATHPDAKAVRRATLHTVSPLKLLGQELGLSVNHIPEDKADFKQWQPPAPFNRPPAGPSNHLLVTASFGRILPDPFLNLFAPSHRLNVHPSLLPAYRGAAPIQHVIINGEKETGVCVLGMVELSKGLDSGDIWGKKTVPVPEGSSYGSLRDTLAREGGSLLVSVLRDMLANKASSTPQAVDPTRPRASMITNDTAHVDFTTQTADVIARIDRAISHQRELKAYIPRNERSIKLQDCSVFEPSALRQGFVLPETPGAARFDSTTKTMLVRCAGGTVLSVSKLKMQSRPLLLAKDWWNGTKEWREEDGSILLTHLVL